MKAIVCADLDNCIGKDGDLLIKIPEDMRFFKEQTMGHTVIMGRKTLESIGRPLPGREMYILSNSTQLRNYEYVKWFSGIDNILNEAPIDAIVIGGGSVYKQLLPYCDEVLMTRVCAKLYGDTFFPELPESEWTLIKDSTIHVHAKRVSETEYDRYMYRFDRYVRKEV